MNDIDVNLASLDLNLITALDALLQTQSVSHAASAVGRTQSAMSHSLSRLRDHFRDPILVRDGWTMRPTPKAEQLRPRVAAASRAARLLFEVKAEFNPATTSHRVRIASPDLCVPLFTPFIAALSREASGAAVEFVDAPSTRQAVLNSQADIGFVFGRPKADPNLVLHLIAPLAWCTFAPMGHDYCKTLSQQSWADARHVVVRQSGASEGPVERVLRANRVNRHIACYAPNFFAALALAAQTNALFTTLRTPFADQADQLSMEACPFPFSIPEAPASLIFQSDYGDPYSIWLRKQCLTWLA